MGILQDHVDANTRRSLSQPYAKASLLERMLERLAFRILDHKRFRQMMREVVLAVVSEQWAQTQAGAVNAFFDCLAARRVRVTLDDDGKLHQTGPIGADLKAVFIVYRDPIIARLRREREAAKVREQRGTEAQR
jgi:hypothetical protein